MTFVRAIRQNRPRWMVIAVLMALVPSLLVSQFAAANAAATRSAGAATTQSGAKPTIVLVHGAWADSGSWDGVVARLQAGGYTVTAPPNPLRGLPDDAAYLAAFLASVPGPMVVVGHSYGGAVITNAATGNPNVTALVYVDAFIPAQDETLLQLVSAQPGSCVGGDPVQTFNLVPYPGAPAGAVDAALTQRSGPPAWLTIPSWALVGTADPPDRRRGARLELSLRRGCTGRCPH